MEEMWNLKQQERSKYSIFVLYSLVRLESSTFPLTKMKEHKSSKRTLIFTQVDRKKGVVKDCAMEWLCLNCIISSHTVATNHTFRIFFKGNIFPERWKMSVGRKKVAETEKKSVDKSCLCFWLFNICLFTSLWRLVLVLGLLVSERFAHLLTLLENN